MRGWATGVLSRGTHWGLRLTNYIHSNNAYKYTLLMHLHFYKPYYVTLYLYCTTFQREILYKYCTFDSTIFIWHSYVIVALDIVIFPSKQISALQKHFLIWHYHLQSYAAMFKVEAHKQLGYWKHCGFGQNYSVVKVRGTFVATVAIIITWLRSGNRRGHG